MYYYNIYNLNRNSNSRICNVLLIYDYIKFNLEILEYCDNKSLAERKQIVSIPNNLVSQKMLLAFVAQR